MMVSVMQVDHFGNCRRWWLCQDDAIRAHRYEMFSFASSHSVSTAAATCDSNASVATWLSCSSKRCRQLSELLIESVRPGKALGLDHSL
jgi:hypothetical protein